MKNALAIILALVLMLTLLGGCGSTKVEETVPKETQNTENVEEVKTVEGYKLGMMDMTAGGSSVGLSTTKMVQDLCDTTGAELLRAPLTGFDDAAFMALYESLIDQGCDGILITTFSEGPISLLADMCEEAGVDWFLVNRKISDPDLLEKVFANPYLVGNSYCAEEQNAYDMVCHLNEELGVQNLAVIGLTEGDLNGDLRDSGIARACEDCGVNLLTETRGISTVDDVTNAVESIIASYPELDGIFIVGGTVTSGALAGATQALENHGLSDKVAIAMVDISTGMGEHMGEGQPLKLVAGGNLQMDYMIGATSLLNHAMGVNTDEAPYIINTHMFHIASEEDANNYDEYCENPDISPISGTQWYDLFLGKSVEEIQEFMDSYDIETAKELRE